VHSGTRSSTSSLHARSVRQSFESNLGSCESPPPPLRGYSAVAFRGLPSRSARFASSTRVRRLGDQTFKRPVPFGMGVSTKRKAASRNLRAMGRAAQLASRLVDDVSHLRGGRSVRRFVVALAVGRDLPFAF
jgi:hypothetical protein